MSRVGCTVWGRLNGRDIVLFCSWACSVKNRLPDGGAWSARSKSLRCDVVGKRPVSGGWWCIARSRTGLDLKATVKFGSQWQVQLSANGCSLYAQEGRVHEMSWQDSRVSIVLCWCGLAEHHSWSATGKLLLLNCFSLGKPSQIITCGWRRPTVY